MNDLELRKYQKSKRPAFFRQDAKKRKRLTLAWRRPKGIQSKQRLKRKGHPHPIEAGYRSPKSVRGADKSGLFPVMVAALSDIEAVNAKTQGIIIRKGVGLGKRMAILETAAKKGIKVLNVKMEKLVQKQEARKKASAEKKGKRAAESETKAKRTPSKKTQEKKEDAMTEEEKKASEKEEKDKILTKRDL